MSAVGKIAVRRTQQERREATIRKLLDATTDTLIELGYAETSVQRICDRAGVSQGALFRQFAMREALIVAVGTDIAERLLDGYRKRFVALARKERDLATALRFVRDACRSRLNQAWYELQLASRTSENLRKALEPVARAHFAAITELARELLPELALALGPTFPVVITAIIAMLDGETVQRFVVRDPAVEDARLELLVRGFALLEARRPA